MNTHSYSSFGKIGRTIVFAILFLVFASVSSAIIMDNSRKQLLAAPATVGMLNDNAFQNFNNRGYIKSIKFEVNKSLSEISSYTSVGNNVYANLNTTSGLLTIYTTASKVYAPSNSSSLFANIVMTNFDGTNFDTSYATTLNELFYNCSKLKTITGISNWNTSKVQNFSYMFANCNDLNTELNLSAWDTSVATDMSSMFDCCENVRSVDMSNWNTSNVTNMSSLFASCSKIQTLDISSFQTSKVTSTWAMFFNCSSLKSITFDHLNFDTGNVEYMSQMFFGCSSLNGLDISWFDVSSVTNFASMFANTSLTTLQIKDWDTSCGSIFSSMFKGCSSLVSLDLNSWDMSNATDLSMMFFGCNGLTELKINNWNTSNVKNLYQTFANCSLTSYDLHTNGQIWNTSNVTNIQEIFSSPLENIDSLNISGWDLSKVSGWDDVFLDSGIVNLNMSGCKISQDVLLTMINALPYSLVTIDMSNATIKDATDLGELFIGFQSLETVRMNNLNTPDLTDVYNMFQDCAKLTQIETTGWNLGKATNFNCMFKNCTSLVNITLDSSVLVKPQQLSEMFSGCIKLEKVKISSNFDMSQVNDASKMFKDTILKELNISSLGNWANAPTTATYTDMFDGVTSVENAVLSNDDALKTELAKLLVNSAALINLDISNSHVLDGYTTTTIDWQNMCLEKLVIRPSDLGNKEITLPQTMYYVGKGYDTITASLSTDIITLTDTNILKGLINTKAFANLAEKTSITDISFSVNNRLSNLEEFTKCGTETYYEIVDNKMIIRTTGTKVYSPEDSSELFKGFTALKAIKFENFSTELAVNLSGMFQNCSSLVNMILENSFIDGVNFSDTFNGCTSLEEITLRNTRREDGNVVFDDSSRMFSNCISLKSFDLGLNAHFANNASKMFENCNSLIELDIAKLGDWSDPYILNTYEDMFDGVTQLEKIDCHEGQFEAKLAIVLAKLICENSPNLIYLDISNFDYYGFEYLYNNDNDTMSIDFTNTCLETLIMNPSILRENDTILLPSYMYYNGVAYEFVDPTIANTVITFSSTVDIYGMLNTDAFNLINTNKANVTSINFKSNQALSSIKDYEKCGNEVFYNVSNGVMTIYTTNVRVLSPINSNYLFRNFTGLSSINFSKFDTSYATSMSSMFSNCSKLSSIDTTNLNLSKVTDFSFMMSGCSLLESARIISNQPVKPVNLSQMFNNCYSLLSLEFSSNFDMTNLTNADKMLANNAGLKAPNMLELDLSKLGDWSKAGNVSCTDMFTGMTSSLENLVLCNDNAIASAVIEMLKDCPSLIKLDVSESSIFSSYTSNLIDWAGLVCLETLTINPTKLNNKVISLPFTMYYNGKGYENITSSIANETITLKDYNDRMGILYVNAFASLVNKESITSIEFFVNKLLSNISMYTICGSNVYYNVENNKLNVYTTESKVIGNSDSSALFSGFESLKSLNLTNFDSSEITNATDIFSGISEIEEIYLTNWNFESEITKVAMVDILNGLCDYIQVLDLTNLDMSLFIDDIDLSGFTMLDTLKCNPSTLGETEYSLPTIFKFRNTYIDTISASTASDNITINALYGVLAKNGNWTSSVYKNAVAIEFKVNQNLDDISGYDFISSRVYSHLDSNNKLTVYTSEGKIYAPIDSSYLFSFITTVNGSDVYGYKNLESIDFTNFDTSLVKNMDCMFLGNSSLEILDLSKFNTSNVVSMENMFKDCNNLKEINMINFDFSNVTTTVIEFSTSLELLKLDTSSMPNTLSLNFGNPMYCNGSIVTVANSTSNIFTNKSLLNIGMQNGMVALAKTAEDSYLTEETGVLVQNCMIFVLGLSLISILAWPYIKSRKKHNN